MEGASCHAPGVTVPTAPGRGATRPRPRSVAGTQLLKRIEIVRNGVVVYDVRPDDWTFEAGYVDDDSLEALWRAATFPSLAPFVYYYLRVTQEDRNQAWSSPIWPSKRS
jgi:hypothetical protein